MKCSIVDVGAYLTIQSHSIGELGLEGQNSEEKCYGADHGDLVRHTELLVVSVEGLYN